MANDPILDVSGLQVEFRTRQGTATVLNDVEFSLQSGETLGIVGESGCGKSMTALAIMQLIPSPPGRISAGRVLFKGEDLLQTTDARMRKIRGRDISMIFQEPMTSLNPVFTVGNQIAEALGLHTDLKGKAARNRTMEMLEAVGIPAPERRIDEYPHQMSGGMRQRIMIAMALACEPSVIIADEPTTALDVTVQAQILDLLKDLQTRIGTAIILITHDMGVVAQMADRITVMYAGHAIERASTQAILDNPLHPYTRGLIDCVPTIHGSGEGTTYLPEIQGMVPSIWELGQGCPYASRCPEVFDYCRSHLPPRLTPAANRDVACWLYDDGVKQ